jgi:hypothetical protein
MDLGEAMGERLVASGEQFNLEKGEHESRSIRMALQNGLKDLSDSSLLYLKISS